jgi:predicted transcriptional regulator
MLEILISNKTRVKILVKFFSRPKVSGYLRGLEEEFGDSSNAIRLELNRFEAAGILLSHYEGKRKFYFANTHYPGFQELKKIVKKHIGGKY